MPLRNGTRRLFLCTAASTAAVPLLARAAGRPSLEMRVLLGESGTATSDILKALTARFPAARVIGASGIEERKSGLVYVALGAAALQSALATGTSVSVLALFTSNEAYTRIVARAERRPDSVAALFAEAGPLQQLKLARALYKRRIGVTALFSAGTSHLQSLVEQAARAHDLELHARVVDTGDNVVQAMLSQRDARAVLMIPDRNLYTADNLRNVLESAYRRELGVIGFSPSLVRAGALAAAYSTIDDVMAQVGAVAEALAMERPVPPQYPAFWRVLINDRVANSLDIVVGDADRELGNFPRGS
jgi:putative tryptophan/tyrosine transport system substrate-binding protein